MQSILHLTAGDRLERDSSRDASGDIRHHLSLCMNQHLRFSLLTYVLQMVVRVCPIPMFVGCHDGAYGLRPAPSFRKQAPIYCSLLRLHLHDYLLLAWSESLLHGAMLVTESVFTNSAIAPKHRAHSAFCYCTTGMSCLVSCQLLSHGVKRPAHRNHVWCPPSCCMDDRLIQYYWADFVIRVMPENLDTLPYILCSTNECNHSYNPAISWAAMIYNSIFSLLINNINSFTSPSPCCVGGHESLAARLGQPKMSIVSAVPLHDLHGANSL
jgi:hypothetical protein